MNRKFIRFEGFLSEHLDFRRLPGWETEKIWHRPAPGSSEYLVRLLDGEGKGLLEVRPSLSERFIRGDGDDRGRCWHLLAYVPFREDGRTIVLLRGSQLLHSETVVARPPVLGRIEVRPEGDDRFRLTWTASHPERRALLFNVGCLDGRGRTVNLAMGVKKKTLLIDAIKLPGGSVRFLVLATDGTRSASAKSRKVRIRSKPPLVTVFEPREGEVYRPWQPIALVGRVCDVLGTRIESGIEEWELDGIVLSKKMIRSALPGLAPGEHRVVLHYRGSGYAVASDTVTFTVSQIEGRNEEYFRLLDYLEGEQKTRA